MTATPRRIAQASQEAQTLYAEDLAQSLQDDLDDEGYFYADHPEQFSVGRPPNMEGK